MKIGTPLALTGPAAPAVAPLGVAQQAAVDYFNETADLPVELELIVKDDQFAPDKTLAVAQELVQSDEVGVLNGVVGTANVAAAREVAQQYCVPLIAATSGGRSANDPTNYPFTVPWSLPSYVDVSAWVAHLEEDFPDGAKVAVYTANTESGEDYLEAIEELTEGTNLEVVSETTIEAADSAPPAAQVTTMKASGANVLFAAPSPTGQCSSLMTEVANQGWDLDAFMLTTQCTVLQLMEPAGAAADGVFASTYINDPALDSAQDDEGVQEYVAAVEQYQPGKPIVGSTMSGFSEIEVLVRAIEQADGSPLGASPLGILYAATHMTFQSKAMLPGVTYSLNYPQDQVAMESAQLSQFSDGQWEKVQVFDFNGETTGKASIGD
nr:ABC transporter substrate-binding protein [Nocardioides zeae]